MDSILTSIKKLLGLDEEYTHFDNDIIMYINSALFRLRTLGVGQIVEGETLSPIAFKISDKTAVWSDLLEDRDDLESVKTYVYLKVRLIFDPPQTSFVIEAYNKQLQELEWLINEQAGGGLDE